MRRILKCIYKLLSRSLKLHVTTTLLWDEDDKFELLRYSSCTLSLSDAGYMFTWWFEVSCALPSVLSGRADKETGVFFILGVGGDISSLSFSFFPLSLNGSLRRRFVKENSLRRSEGEGTSRCWFSWYISSGDRQRVNSDDSSNKAGRVTLSLRCPVKFMGSAMDTISLFRRWRELEE